MELKKMKVEFHSGNEEGNIWWILSKVREALRKQQRITDYNDLRDKVLICNTYEEALASIREKVNLVDLDGKY